MPRTKPLIKVDPLLELAEMDVGMLRQLSGMENTRLSQVAGINEKTLSRRLKTIGDLRLSEWVAIRNAMRKEAEKCGYTVPDIVLMGSEDMQQLRHLLQQTS